MLFHALCGARYTKTEIPLAFEFMARTKLTGVEIRNEHELDALISAWAAREGILNKWRDLCETGLPDLIFPAGPVSYFWPDEEAAATVGPVVVER